MTPALWITLIAVGAVVLSIASWWGVRKLGRKHNRSAVGEPAQPGPSGPQKVAVVLNPVKAQANQAKSAIRAAIADAGWPEPLFLETTVADPGSAPTRQALNWGADVVVVGMGLGLSNAAETTLSRLFSGEAGRIVVDADALQFIGDLLLLGRIGGQRAPSDEIVIGGADGVFIG